MIAILKDRKGFTKSIMLPARLPIVYVPLPARFNDFFCTIDEITRPTEDKLAFRVVSDLGHDVWLYEEC